VCQVVGPRPGRSYYISLALLTVIKFEWMERAAFKHLRAETKLQAYTWRLLKTIEFTGPCRATLDSIRYAVTGNNRSDATRRSATTICFAEQQSRKIRTVVAVQLSQSQIDLAPPSCTVLSRRPRSLQLRRLHKNAGIQSVRSLHT